MILLDILPQTNRMSKHRFSQVVHYNIITLSQIESWYILENIEIKYISNHWENNKFQIIGKLINYN